MIFKYIVLFFCISIFLSCSNIFEEATPKDTDKVIFYDAKMNIDDGDWTGAITKISELSAEYQAKREVQNLLASAYAGRCGLNLIGLIQDLGESSTDRLFRKLMRAFPDSSHSQVADCITAEGILKNINSSFALRTIDENILMAFISLAKIGTILDVSADLDDDGRLDDAFDPCYKSQLSETYTAELVTAIGLFIISLGGVGTNIADTQTTDITSICDGLSDINFSICDIVNASSVNVEHRKTIRGMLAESQQLGLGSCSNSPELCRCEL